MLFLKGILDISSFYFHNRNFVRRMQRAVAKAVLFSVFAARVIQHEYDHLDGKLFVDRLSPLRKTLIKGKLAAMAKGKYKAAYKTKLVRK